MSVALGLSLTVVLLGQAPPPPDPVRSEDSAARLDYMKQSVKIYEIHAADDRARRYRLRPEPILRYSNPVGQSRDGAIFLWLGEHDRPEVAVQVSVVRSGYWDHQFSSLSTRPVRAEARTGEVWNPGPGVEFKAIPGAAKPLASPEARLRQMRSLAREFAAEDRFQHQSWQKLRLMPKPLARHGEPGTALIDGAVYCFALGTDPELVLMIEARAAGDGPGWYYAFAPITGYELKGMHKDRPVWSFKVNGSTTDPRGTVFNTQYKPEGSRP